MARKHALTFFLEISIFIHFIKEDITKFCKFSVFSSFLSPKGRETYGWILKSVHFPLKIKLMWEFSRHNTPLARIGISNYEMNLEEPTLIYVHTCFGSPEKSKPKSFHKGFLRKGGKFKSTEWIIIHLSENCRFS